MSLVPSGDGLPEQPAMHRLAVRLNGLRAEGMSFTETRASRAGLTPPTARLRIAIPDPGGSGAESRRLVSWINATVRDAVAHPALGQHGDTLWQVVIDLSGQIVADLRGRVGATAIEVHEVDELPPAPLELEPPA